MEKSAWARYCEEVSGTKFIERPYGFISYSFLPDVPECIYLETIWIEPEHRKSGLGLKLVEEAEEIGRVQGKTFSMAVISVKSKTVKESLKAHLALDFIPYYTEGNNIFLQRSLIRKAE
jgi:GNAT superfamily N-acetyltransferase